MILGLLWPSRNGQGLIEDLGFLAHEPEEDYRALSREYLDAEQLGDFREDAFLFHKRQRGLVPPPTRRGAELDAAAAVRIAQGRDQYLSSFAINGPIDPETGEPYGEYSYKYREWAAQQSKPVLNAEQAEQVEHIDFAYRAHDAARSLLADGVPFGVVRAKYCGIPCQARVDWLNPRHGVVAILACDRFSWRDLHVRDNIHQLAFHRALLAEACGRHLPVHVIALEKQIPHRCGVWRISGWLLRRAQKENEKALARLHECRRFNRWPTGYERVRKLAPIGI